MWLCTIPVPQTPLVLVPGGRVQVQGLANRSRHFWTAFERRGQTPLRDCHPSLGTNSTSPGPRSRKGAMFQTLEFTGERVILESADISSIQNHIDAR